MTDVQRVALKILADAPPALNLDPFLGIFGRWRTEKAEAEWIDLADYAHMPQGPGIVLVGKACTFGFDLSGRAPGLLYTSRKGLEGTIEQRLAAVLRAGFELSSRLIAESEFPAGVRLDTGRLELIFNDRMETPHAEETDRLLRPAVSAVLEGLLAPAVWHMSPEPDSGRRFGYSIRSAPAVSLDTLLARLQNS